MKTINVQFTGITFSDPNFPLGSEVLNGVFTCKSEDAPLDRLSWTYRGQPNAQGVEQFIRVIQGLAPNVYHQVVMELTRIVTGQPNTSVLIFAAQQPTLPVTNTLTQYGGTANVV